MQIDHAVTEFPEHDIAAVLRHGRTNARLEQLLDLGDHLVVVVGHGREQVVPHVEEIAPWAVTVVQEQQNGTGHAVRIALAGAIQDKDAFNIVEVTGKKLPDAEKMDSKGALEIIEAEFYEPMKP
mgnify:CR=1 FL=1